MIIKVTQKHIDEGKPSSCGSCPIALAVLESDNRIMNVQAMLSVIRIDFDGSTPIRVITTPYEAVRFMRKFDWGQEVEPFEFELNL
jgi:hypothetical protein